MVYDLHQINTTPITMSPITINQGIFEIFNNPIKESSMLICLFEPILHNLNINVPELCV